MISHYRLGDLFAFGLNVGEKTINEILNNHKGSIASDYILSNRNVIGAEYIKENKELYTTCINNIQNIVLEHVNKNLNLLPNDIENSTVIHLRLGDVIAGNEWHEKIKRPLSIDYLKKICPPNQKIYIIGKCFFAESSSTNYNECIEMSNKYLHDLLNILNAEYFDGGDPDIDLCCGVKSKLFIQGRGFFSNLIVNIRKNLNLENIETTTTT
jgi:hypothetical protein